MSKGKACWYRGGNRHMDLVTKENLTNLVIPTATMTQQRHTNFMVHAVMSKGKVVESGRHVDLMSKENGAYATLMRLQQSLPEADATDMKNPNLDTATTLYVGQEGAGGHTRTRNASIDYDGEDSQLDTSSTISMDESLTTIGTLDTDAGLLGTVRPFFILFVLFLVIYTTDLHQHQEYLFHWF